MRFRVFIKPTPSQKAYYHIFRFAQRTADILCIICIRNSLLILIGFLHFRVYQIHKSVKGDIIINPDFLRRTIPVESYVEIIRPFIIDYHYISGQKKTLQIGRASCRERV